MAIQKHEIESAFERYGHLVFRRCLLLLRETAGADDALQEVFVRLMKYPKGFVGAKRPLMWLYQVANRVCFDELARRQKAQIPMQELCDAQVDEKSSNDDQHHSDREIVLSFLMRFDLKTRQLAIMYFVDEMSQEDIAQELGWSRQTIYKKIRKIKERAKKFSRRLGAEK
jgi:RNA polymerase sigma-70 factor (ECF subfamily)